MNDFDVVIVGGRVAGASTALLLARAGPRVAVVDRSAQGSDTVSTHALMRAGVLQLGRWGVLPELVAAGTPPIRDATFHYPDGATESVAIRPTHGVETLYAPRRFVLDSLLSRAAAAAGAQVVHATTVVGLLRDHEGGVSGVRLQGTTGDVVQLKSALVVGADGIQSFVARQVGARVLDRGRAAGAVLYRYVGGLLNAGYVWGYGDGVASGLIPTNDGETCVFVSTAPVRMRALRRHGGEAAFDALLEESPAAVRDAVRASTTAGQLRGWRGIPGQVVHSFGPGWALDGDAGYYKDPITTHGITDALRDAELLADAVLATHGGTPPAEAIGRYQTERRRMSHALAEVTESVSRYDWDDQQIRGLLRSASVAMRAEVDYLTGRPPLASRPVEAAALAGPGA